MEYEDDCYRGLLSPCDECKNRRICKHFQNMGEVERTLAGLKMAIEECKSPFTVELKCRFFVNEYATIEVRYENS